MKKKILFIADETLRINGFLLILQQFTINNGCYPIEIQMTKEALENYKNLLIKPPDMYSEISFMVPITYSFRGIPIKQV